LREILGFFSVMREIESDPKCLLHILPHENLKNFALSLLTERYDLLIPKVLLSSLVHLESFVTEPASGWVLRYPDNCLDAREVEKLTDVGEKRICQERLEKR
jgi:hypothetical protein